jgi:hypothetical protein
MSGSCRACSPRRIRDHISAGQGCPRRIDPAMPLLFLRLPTNHRQAVNPAPAPVVLHVPPQPLTRDLRPVLASGLATQLKINRASQRAPGPPIAMLINNPPGVRARASIGLSRRRGPRREGVSPVRRPWVYVSVVETRTSTRNDPKGHIEHRPTLSWRRTRRRTLPWPSRCC